MPGTVVPVVASDWLRHRLRHERRVGEVVGVGDRAVYARFGPPGGRDAWLVAVERHDAVGLPCGVRVPASARMPSLPVGAGVRVTGGQVTIGDTVLRVVRWRRAVPVVTTPSRAVLAGRLARLAGAGHEALSWWPSRLAAPPARLRSGATDLVDLALETHRDESGRAVTATVAALVGWGPGSTPAGDDLLAGFLATLRCLDDVVVANDVVDDLVTGLGHRAPGRTTDLSATLLACAIDGAMAAPAAAFLHAVTTSGTTVDRMQAGLDHLLGIGHTSGHDLALGVLTALHVAVVTTTSPPPLGPRHAPSRSRTHC